MRGKGTGKERGGKFMGKKMWKRKRKENRSGKYFL